MEDDIEIEHSPLSSEIARDGMVVKLCIYRIKGSGEGWTLEVVDQENASTVWDELFETDQEAFDEFEMTLTREGIGSFLRRPDEKLN